MEASTTHLDTTRSRNKFHNVVNSYIPINERTWNYAIPTFGFALSCFSFGMFISYIQDIKREPINNYEMYNFGYLVLAGASGVELYYGLTHRSRRQFAFWTFLKIIEVFLVLSGVIMEFFSRNMQIDFITAGILILVLDLILLYYVMRRSTKRQRKVTENIYEVPCANATNASQFCHVDVY